jgi:hypothetical protein
LQLSRYANYNTRDAIDVSDDHDAYHMSTKTLSQPFLRLIGRLQLEMTQPWRLYAQPMAHFWRMNDFCHQVDPKNQRLMLISISI